MSRIILALLVVLWAVPAWATTYYVRTDGHNTASGLSDTADGTTGAWLTIGKCASSLSAGDVCLVGDGTYTEDVTASADGTSESRIVYTAAHQRLAVVNGIVTISGDYVTFDGFKVVLQAGDDCGVLISGAHSIFQHGAVTALIETAIATNAMGIRANGDYGLVHDNLVELTCMGVSIDSHYTVAEYNEIKNMVTRSLSPLSCGDNDYFRVYGTNNTIRYNYTYGDLETGESHQDCVQTFEGMGSSGVVTDLIYEGNFCAGAGQGPMMSSVTTGGINRVTYRNNVFHVSVNGSVINDAQNVRFYNNTFILDSDPAAPVGSRFTHGIHCYPRTADVWPTSCEFKNNIIYSTAVWPTTLWYVCSASDNCTLIDGDASSPGKNNLLYESGTTITGFASDVKNVDPVFANTVGNSYTLSSGSPAINAGYAISSGSWASPTDKLGVARPQGAAWDIGAYEGASAGVPTAPTSVRIR